MILYQKEIDGYDVTIETTEMYDEGMLTPDDDEPSATLTIKGKGKSIKSPILGKLPKVVTDDMVRRILEEEEL